MTKKTLVAVTLAFSVLLASCGIPNLKNTKNAPDSFAGEWESDGTILDIWVDDDGVCHGEVTRVLEENVVSFWSFSGEPENGAFSYSDGKKITATYDEGGDVSEDHVYEDGRGSITKNKEGLIWEDKVEDAGSGQTFTYTGEY